MSFLDKWNKNKFNVYDSEEKTVLKIISKIGDFIGELSQGIDNKTDLNGDHKGSWQGLNKPTLSDEGMRATVEKLDNELINVNDELKEIPKKQDKSDLEVHVINLGLDNGLCVLVKIDDKTLLYDVGYASTTNKIVEFCLNKGLKKIDYIIISHWHSDHAGGLEGLLNSSLDLTSCKYILPPEVDYSRITEDKGNILLMKQKAESLVNFIIPTNAYELTIGKASIKFLNCTFDDDYYNSISESGFISGTNVNGLNNFSTVCLIDYNGTKILLNSDIEKLAQSKIKNGLPNVDFMIAPHHFFNKSCDGEFYRRLSPTNVVVSGNIGSSGLFNVVDFYYLREIGSKIYGTKSFNQDCSFELKGGTLKAINTMTIEYRTSNMQLIGNNQYSIFNAQLKPSDISFSDIFKNIKIGNIFIGNLNDCTMLVEELKATSGNFYTNSGENIFIINKVSPTKMLINIIVENMNSSIEGYYDGTSLFLQNVTRQLRISNNTSFTEMHNILQVGQSAISSITTPTNLNIDGIPTSVNSLGIDIKKISSTNSIISLISYTSLVSYIGYYSTTSNLTLFKKI